MFPNKSKLRYNLHKTDFTFIFFNNKDVCKHTKIRLIIKNVKCA